MAHMHSATIVSCLADRFTLNLVSRVDGRYTDEECVRAAYHTVPSSNVVGFRYSLEDTR